MLAQSVGYRLDDRGLAASRSAIDYAEARIERELDCRKLALVKGKSRLFRLTRLEAGWRTRLGRVGKYRAFVRVVDVPGNHARRAERNENAVLEEVGANLRYKSRFSINGLVNLVEEDGPRAYRVGDCKLLDVVDDRGADAAHIVLADAELVAHMLVNILEAVVWQLGEKIRILLHAHGGLRSPLVVGGLGHLDRASNRHEPSDRGCALALIVQLFNRLLEPRENRRREAANVVRILYLAPILAQGFPNLVFERDADALCHFTGKAQQGTLVGRQVNRVVEEHKFHAAGITRHLPLALEAEPLTLARHVRHLALCDFVAPV